MRLQNNRVDGEVHEQALLLEQQKAHNSVRCPRRESKEALLVVHARLAAAESELKRLHFMAKKFKGVVTDAWADAFLQALLNEAYQEQLDVKVAELKKVRSHLGMREDYLSTLHENQTCVAAE